MCIVSAAGQHVSNNSGLLICTHCVHVSWYTVIDICVQTVVSAFHVDLTDCAKL